MMKKLFFYSIFTFLLGIGLLVSCQKGSLNELQTEHAELTSSSSMSRGVCGLNMLKNDGCCIYFDVHNNNGYGFKIDLGDGETIVREEHTNTSFSHCYSKGGTYKITLTYYDPKGKPVCGSSTFIKIDCRDEVVVIGGPELEQAPCCNIGEYWFRNNIVPNSYTFIVRYTANKGDVVLVNIDGTVSEIAQVEDCELEQAIVSFQVEECETKHISVQILKKGESCDSIEIEYNSPCKF